MRHLLIILATCFGFCVCESTMGQHIRVSFSASAFETNASEREIAPGIFVSSGDSVVGVFDYELNAEPVTDDGTLASYSQSTPASFSITTNGVTFSTIGEFRVNVSNDSNQDGLSGADSLTLTDGFDRSINAGPSGEHIELDGQIISGSTTLILHDESATAWETVALPGNLDLSDFSATLGSVDGVNVEGNSFGFLYTIDSLNVRAVPEPNSLVCIFAALILLKRRRNHLLH